LEIIGKLVCNKNSPNNRHIIAKIFIKYFLFHPFSISNFAECGNCGAAGAWGGKGGTAVAGPRGVAAEGVFV